MNKLTEYEIAKVFAMYLGADCKYRKGMHIVNDWGIGCFNEDGETEYKMTIGNNTFKLHDRQLLLTPVSKITDEHAIEISDMMGINQKVSRCNLIASAKTYCTTEKNMTYEITQQLIIWEYAVKLYFGKNHWANGKTAIELRIAIERQ